MKKFGFIFALAACFLLLAACTSAQAQEFKSAAGRFSVAAPVQFKEDVQQVDTPEGGKRDVHLFSGEAGKLAYIVSYSDYPPSSPISEADTLLKSMRDVAVASASGGTLKTDQKLSLDGNPGWEFTMDFKGPNNEPFTSKTHTFLVGSRMYQLMVIADQGANNQAEMDSFLNSFKLYN